MEGNWGILQTLTTEMEVLVDCCAEKFVIVDLQLNTTIIRFLTLLGGNELNEFLAIIFNIAIFCKPIKIMKTQQLFLAFKKPILKY